MTEHAWPTDTKQHVWGPWMNDQPRKGTRAPTQYRQCCHPLCNAVDRRTVAGA